MHVHENITCPEIFRNAAPKTRYDKQSPYVHIMKRNGKMFGAGFKVGVQPEKVAQVILEAIETPEYRLRWLVGEDAEGLVHGRRAMSDEDFVAMGGLEDEEYNARYNANFGIEL